MAPSDEYVKALEKSLSDLADCVQKRDLLNAQIAGLRETVRVLSSRVQLPAEKQQEVAQLLAMVDYATPNLTSAIRVLLMKVYPHELTAIDVRNSLESNGFNFDDFSNSLSACHAALKRMTPDEIELGTPREGKATYRGILRVPHSLTLSALMGNVTAGSPAQVKNVFAERVAPRKTFSERLVDKVVAERLADKKK